MEKKIMERKDILIGVGVLVFIAILVFGFGSRETEAPAEVIPANDIDAELSGSDSETAVGPTWETDSSNLDLGNVTYSLEGEAVQLQAGQSVTAEGSRVSLLEGPAFADLNGDNAKDAVVLLREDTGGSGIFYHVAGVLSVSLEGGEATNSILLGDRIRIKQIRVSNGVVTISTLERMEGQPMTAEPAEPRTRTFQLEGGQLVELQ
jgi:hypothetical protein